MLFNGIDFEKNLDEVLKFQDKVLKGINVIQEVQVSGVDSTPKDLVYSEDKMKLYHYKSTHETKVKIPTLIVYALVNKQYMMDIQEDRSMIKNLQNKGLDLYIVDWGYPAKEDMYLTMDDYINGYINNCVDHIRKEKGVDKVNLLGVCQGGTFSTIYSSIYPEKINTLTTMVTPIDFDVETDALLFKWSKHLNIDSMVDAFGVIPGSFMNSGYMALKPFQLALDKYVDLLDDIDNPEKFENFLRMEQWIFDSPGQAGEAIRQFVNDLYKENKLVKGELVIGDKKVNLKNINMPILNIYAEYDHLVPPVSSRRLNDLVSSKDKELVSFKTGHIGMYVSSKSQTQVAPKIAEFTITRD